MELPFLMSAAFVDGMFSMDSDRERPARQTTAQATQRRTPTKRKRGQVRQISSRARAA
jgi:hypothetical protein